MGAPQTVNLERVLLPTGESLSEFVANIHFMGEKLQPFMDFAVGADAELSERFSFREAGAQVAGSQRDGSPGSGCAAACREMARLLILANHRSLRTWEDEWVILPTVPGAAQPLLPGAPEPGALTEAEGPAPDNMASSLTDRESTSSDGGKERERRYARNGERGRANLKAEQARVRDSRTQSEGGWTVQTSRQRICARCWTGTESPV